MISGAGIVPFAWDNEKQDVYFLFHEMFSGKKVGYLVDFGGGVKENETDLYEIASREFCEETGGLFYVDDVGSASETLSNVSNMEINSLVKGSISKLRTLLKADPFSIHLKSDEDGYHLFMLEVSKIDAQYFDKAFTSVPKKRCFEWISGDSILNECTRLPLFPRFKLQGYKEAILQIKRYCLEQYCQ